MSEECTECENEFYPEDDDGCFWRDAPDSNFWLYICHSCVEGERDKKEAREAAEEDYGRAKARGEI